MQGVAVHSYCEQNSHNIRKQYFIERSGLCVSHFLMMAAGQHAQRKVGNPRSNS